MIWLIGYIVTGLLLYMAIGGCQKTFTLWTCLQRLVICAAAGPLVFVVGFCIAWRRMRRKP